MNSRVSKIKNKVYSLNASIAQWSEHLKGKDLMFNFHFRQNVNQLLRFSSFIFNDFLANCSFVHFLMKD